MNRLQSYDARVKLLLAVGALLIAISARSPLGPALLGAMALGSYVLLGGSKARLGRAARTWLLASAIPVALVFYFRGSSTGLEWTARLLGASALSFWLAASTELAALAGALTALRVPRSLVELMVLAHRYIRVIGEGLSTAREAQQLRLGYVGLLPSLRSTGTLAGLALRRAVDQAATLGDVLRLRGYRGHLWIAPPGPLARRDRMLAAVGVAVVALSALVAWRTA